MRLTRLAALAVAAVIPAGAATAAYAASNHATAANPAQQDAFVQRCTDMYNQRAWAALEAQCYDTARFVDHTPESGQAPTWAGFEQTTNEEDVAFPDWKTTTVDLTSQGNRVVMRFIGTGTQTGPLGGLPATGHKVTITGMRMFQIEGGRITDTWVNYDELGLLQQLGVVPRF